MVAMFAAGLATFVLLYSTQALLPAFGREFGVSPSASTLTVSLTTAALALALLVAGPVSEIVGRTRLIHLSMWASVVVAAACALAPNWSSLVGLRMLAGLALAGLPAVATAYLREELHPSAQARAVGLYIGGTGIGGMAGRLVTAPIADVAGWRWAMGAAAVFALVCAVLVGVLLPASRNFHPSPASRATLVRMARDALTDRALLALYLLGACVVGTLVATLNALGFRLTSSPFHLSLGAVALIYLVYALGTASSIAAGRLSDLHDRRDVVPFGCAIALIGVALTLSSVLPVVVVGIALITIGFFWMHGIASSWVTVRAHASGASTSQAASFYLFSYYVGSSVFGNLGATAWTHAGWHGVVLLTSGLLLVSAALIAFLRHVPALAPAQHRTPAAA
ncbi:MFS transporter [Nocardioides sp. JQ2195]|nr:MFS transporter [Nocardioides sp. JQ2195]